MTQKAMPILLIEDNPADAYLVKTYLSEASVRHDLFESDTLFEGLNILQEREIHMVLLDLALPDSQGFKTLTTLLEKRPDVPVIVMTGLNNEIVGNQAVRAGAQDFLVKGQFDGKLLGRAIRYAQQRFKEQLKRDELLQHVAESEKQYAEAQALGHFGNWKMDLVTNEMIWTDELYRIFGAQPGGLQPTLSVYQNYVHPEDRNLVADFFEAALKTGRRSQIEHRLLIAGTQVKYVSLTAKINVEEHSGKVWLMGIVQDITERKVTERLLIEKNLSQKSNILKEEALADLSFQIRTPLSSIVNLMYLLDNSAISTQQKELLESLRTSVDDLSIIINNLLNLSLLATEKLKLDDETFTFRDFFQSIKKLVQIKSESSGVRISYQIDRNFPEKGIGDVKKLTQIIYNLTHHALRISERGEEVRVKFGLRELDAKNMLFDCDISYRGKTMSFERFQKIADADNLLKTYTDAEGATDEKMLEISFAIVSKLVSAMGGSMNFHPDEVQGNRITFQLPLKIAKTIKLKPGDAPDAPLRILLVEDHFLNQIATKKVLLAWSEFITVDIAENGMVGVEKFRSYGYDLILMDIQMPVMNGLDATRKIREQSAVPIIALTANATRLEMEKCLETGMNDYLAKPFKPQELYAKIMALMVAHQD